MRQIDAGVQHGDDSAPALGGPPGAGGAYAIGLGHRPLAREEGVVRDGRRGGRHAEGVVALHEADPVAGAEACGHRAADQLHARSHALAAHHMAIGDAHERAGGGLGPWREGHPAEAGGHRGQHGGAETGAGIRDHESPARRSRKAWRTWRYMSGRLTYTAALSTNRRPWTDVRGDVSPNRWPGPR